MLASAYGDDRTGSAKASGDAVQGGDSTGSAQASGDDVNREVIIKMRTQYKTIMLNTRLKHLILPTLLLMRG